MTRTFIYGSCVSRDTFEFLIPGGYELLGYIARQSLISAATPPSSVPLPEVEVSSAFQQRMLIGDWESNLLPTLTAYAEWTDLLLWDLCDERLGIRRWEAGTVTRSVDSISVGLDEELAQTTQLIRLGDPMHLASYTEALRVFHDLLSQVGLLDRTVLVAPPWASMTQDGAPTPPSYGLPPDEANAFFKRYEAAAREILGVPVVSIPAETARADSDHRWGIAPFHYSKDVYRTLAGDIEAHRPPRRTMAVDRQPSVFYYGPIGELSPLYGLETEFRKTGHVTQQSLISASSPPTKALTDPPGLSASVAKTVTRDLRSSLYSLIRSAADITDLLLLDLSVEKYGVLRLPDGSYVTRSPELLRSGLVGSLSSNPTWVRPGEARHTRLWLKAAEEFVFVLDEVGIKERTLVVAPHTGALEPSIGAMVDHLADLGVPVASGFSRSVIRSALVAAQQRKLNRPGVEAPDVRW